jgi:hypothetical protein
VSGQLHAPATLLRGKSPQSPLDRRLGGPQIRSGRLEEVKILDPTGTGTPTPPSSSVIPVLYIESYSIFKWNDRNGLSGSTYGNVNVIQCRSANDSVWGHRIGSAVSVIAQPYARGSRHWYTLQVLLIMMMMIRHFSIISVSKHCSGCETKPRYWTRCADAQVMLEIPTRNTKQH